MPRTIIPTKLFGWCFPYMGPDQHAKCPQYSGSVESPRECACVCHTAPEKPKKRKKKG